MVHFGGLVEITSESDRTILCQKHIMVESNLVEFRVSSVELCHSILDKQPSYYDVHLTRLSFVTRTCDRQLSLGMAAVQLAGWPKVGRAKVVGP